MANHTLNSIKETEENCRKYHEQTKDECAQAIRRMKADCDARISAEKEKCAAEFAGACASTEEKASAIYAEAEQAALSEAETFIQERSTHLPEAVKLIIGRIVGQWL